MSITAYKIEAIGHDRTGEDYGYVNIMYRYGNKQSCPRPDQCEKMEVMWADESVYGPPAPGSKVGDFIQWLPEREVDLVYLYSDHYLDARNPTPVQTDFFTVTRTDAWGVSTWFMCTPEAAGKLIVMDYDNLAIKETTIVG